MAFSLSDKKVSDRVTSKRYENGRAGALALSLSLIRFKESQSQILATIKFTRTDSYPYWGPYWNVNRP